MIIKILNQTYNNNEKKKSKKGTVDLKLCKCTNICNDQKFNKLKVIYKNWWNDKQKNSKYPQQMCDFCFPIAAVVWSACSFWKENIKDLLKFTLVFCNLLS